MSSNSARFVVLAMGAVGVMAGTAAADVISIMGDYSSSIEQTGVSFAATLDYSYSGGSSGMLTIDISNSTSPSSVGGYLTGFVFNILSTDAFATASLVSGTNANFLNTGVEAASPFGTFDAGAALGANWLGGGAPQGGLAIGDMGSFQFMVTASDAGMLSASSFVGEGEDFAVRFRGLQNGDSDKLLATPTPGTSVIALMGLGVMARRRR